MISKCHKKEEFKTCSQIVLSGTNDAQAVEYKNWWTCKTQNGDNQDKCRYEIALSLKNMICASAKWDQVPIGEIVPCQHVISKSRNMVDFHFGQIARCSFRKTHSLNSYTFLTTT